MKKKKTAVLLALILGILGILDSIPVEQTTICQASPVSETSIPLKSVELENLYQEVDFSDDFGDLFETATLILGSRAKEFDRQGAIRMLDIGKQMYALSYPDKKSAKMAYLKYQKMSEITFVEPDVIIGTDANGKITESKQKQEKIPRSESGLLSETMSSDDSSNHKNLKKVAIIDTGVEAENAQIAPYLSDPTKEAEDQNGHGTQIAGLIADSFTRNKLTPAQVRIYPVKVADEAGKCTILQLYLGIRQAIDHEADILNISMGTKNIAGSKLLESVIKEAYEKRIIVVTSAGNDNADIAGYVLANLKTVITVGSVDAKKVKSDFSNYGNELDCVAYGESLVAKGLKGRTETVSGTSYAAALVTAELTMKMADGLIKNPDDAMAYLKNTAEDLGTVGWDKDYGYGRIGSYAYVTDTTVKEEAESENKPNTETQNRIEDAAEDTTKPITNYADSGNLSEAQKKEMEACLFYGDILNDINTIATTQNIYAATGLVSIIKTKAAQLRAFIQAGSVTSRYFAGDGYVSLVGYQHIGIDAVDVAGKAAEDTLHTYAITGNESDWKSFCNKLDAFFDVLNANREVTIQAESKELSSLTSDAASDAKKQFDTQNTQGRTEEAVSIEASGVSFSNTDAMLLFQNAASGKLYESLSTYDTDSLKKFVNALSDNDQQLLAERLGAHYQDIMARVYDAEVQTERTNHKTYYVADEAAMRMYSNHAWSGQEENSALINTVLTPKNLSGTVTLTKNISANNYLCVYGEVTITSKNSSQYKMSSNFDNKNQEFTYDSNGTAIFNNTLSMIYVYPSGTLHLTGSAVLNGNGQRHNGFLVFVNPSATLNIRDSATLMGNTFTGYSTQKNGGYGGAIHNEGTVNMSGGTIADNTNIDRDNGILTAGGAAIGNKGGTVNISGGTIRNNSAALGAVWNCAGTLNVSGGTIENNSSRSGSAQGGNIHASIEVNSHDRNEVNINGGVIRNAVAGNGMYIGKGSTCKITGDAYFYGNAESGIGNDGVMTISDKAKIGFVSYKNLSMYSINPNKARGITNNQSGELTINGAVRIFGGDSQALVNDGNCNIKSSSDAIFFCTTADSVVHNTGQLNVAGHDSSGKASLRIYSSASKFGINNGGLQKTGAMRFGGEMDGRYYVTDTSLQGPSEAQHAFTDSCIYTNSKGSYDESHPYALQIYGNAVIRNGATGIHVADGKCYLTSGTITGNTSAGINNSATTEINGANISANSRGVQNKASGNVTMTAGTISSNVSTESGAGIYNSGKFSLNGGTVSGNNAGTYGGGVMNKAGAVFVLNGGNILSNTGNGGGIFNDGIVNMTGGSISGNANHGIYQRGTLNMAGAAAVDTNNDVCLAYGYVVTVNGALTTVGTVANVTPLNKAGIALTKITDKDNYQMGGLGVSVVRTSYINGKASNALYYSSNTARFVLSNGGILRPGDYMDDGVVASEQAKGTISSMIADTDIAISTPYKITYDKNLDNVPVSLPANQSKYWCEDVKLVMGTPVITDATKAAQFEFLHWNDSSKDIGTTYTNGQMYNGNSDITIYAQWQNNINIAYIGNEQQKGNDYTDQNVSQSKDYTFGSNKDVSGGKYFDKTAIKTYTDAETGKEVEQEVGCTVVGWKLGKDEKSKTYQLNMTERCSDIYNTAKISFEAVSYGLPNSDYGTHNSLLKQLNSIHAASQSSIEDAFSLNKESDFNSASIFGANPLDGSKGAPYINLYAVWDEGPSVEAYDLYYDLAFAKSTTDTTGITMEELLSQAKAVDTEDGTLAHGKDVPIGTGKVTSFLVKDYAPTDFSSFTTNGTVRVCYQATDSVGNITEKTILVHIVDTTARDINAGSVRFIDGKYLDQSKENGGFADNSVWKADQSYHDLLASVLGNSKTNIQTAENSFFGKTISIQKPGSGTWKTPPQESWSFTHEQVLAVHDYVTQNGIGNSKSNTALKGFRNQFTECKQ